MITTIFTPAGYATSYILNATKYKDRVIISEEGLGMPSIEYITQRGPFQHGESMVDYFLHPRTIQYIIRHKFCSYQAYINGRAEILDQFRPNKAPVGTFGVLKRHYPDGSKRYINVMIEEGPNFAPHRGGWDEWAYDETIRFVAHDPIWYDPTYRTIALTDATQEEHLVFPITFPILFGVTVFTVVPGIYAVNNQGNWLDYPTIVIQGPITNPSITNMTTGETLALNTTIPDSYSAVFTLEYGNKRVFLNTGEDLMPYITEDSDLTTFHIDPGINVLIGSGIDTSPLTYFEVRWHDRYIGV